MIFGDPYLFGIWLEKVDSWNSLDFENKSEGICAIFINGHMIPNQLPEKSTFLDNSIRSLTNFFEVIDNLENEKLFNLSKEDRFKFFEKTVHYKNQDLSEEDSFVFWQYCLTDYIDNPMECDNIWYVSFQNKEKLIYLYYDIIYEMEFEKGTIKQVIGQALKSKP
ncbi:immunity 42 family protein [Neisseria musculi]|uniref:Uncharacterized protein n=1 Tax=Neisseria musculi TaxID=1815583 RepID=A0A7H1M9H0_9NEIS|nr:immunity 42 family protein [Neisseria musculi]QNT58285.1 hypothetical protein H7A79_0203 [Neisseria musculi]